MEGILEDMIDGFESRWVLCFTLDPRMVTLPEVPEDQEEDVCRVLEIRCKELMWDDETERKWFAQVDEPTSPPQIPHTSDKSHTTNLFGYKKPSKMVPPPHLDPSQNVLDVANLAKEVSPTDNKCLSPLLYTYHGHVFVYVSVPTTVSRFDPYFCLHRRSVNT
jgi:hypothetical protein